MTQPGYLKAKEMAELMRVKTDTIYRWYKTWDGFPQPIKARRPLLWRSDEFLAWVDTSDRFYNKRGLEL